jgi:serine/threonine-protein kinase
MVFAVGATVSGYRIESMLGSGGMGTVYLAADPVLPRSVALKVLSAELSADASFRARFQREADLVATLEHPNIVSVYSRGESESGQLWIAMQYVAGSDAQLECESGRMTPGRAVRIVGEVAKALDYAHRRTLVHRDVKPANFLLAEGDDRILLADFGIARSTDDEAGLTGTGTVMATVSYAAPEMLVSGDAVVDGRADVYALGCSLFRMLSGQTPYASSGGAAGVLAAHLFALPPTLSDAAPGLPAAMDQVIATAMAKDPARRYPSAGALAAAAAGALEGGPCGTAEWVNPPGTAEWVTPSTGEAPGGSNLLAPSAIPHSPPPPRYSSLPPPRWQVGRRSLVIGAVAALAAAGVGGAAWLGGRGGRYTERTVTHRRGVTRLDAQPAAVAALGPGDADAVLSLGVQPVAVLSAGGKLPSYLQSMVDSNVKTLDSLDDTALAITRPDLILDTGEVDQDVYNQLTAIAPSLTRPDGTAWTWQNQLSWIADALGREDRANEILAAASLQQEQARAAHPAFADKTVVAVTVADDGVTAVVPSSRAAAYLVGLGMRYAGSLPAAPPGASTVQVDPASLNTDPTAVRIVLRTDRAAGDGNYNGLPEPFTDYRGATVIVDDPALITALLTGGPAATEFLNGQLVILITEQVK